MLYYVHNKETHLISIIQEEINVMTHEEIARRNIQNAINHIVGSYYTSFLDGYEDDLPKCYEDLEAEVYESSLKDTYAYGGEIVFYNRPVKEMRFAGSDFCKATVHSLLSEDEAVKEMIEDLGWAVTVPDTQEDVIWSGYVLKKTYTEGNSKGTSFIYIRGGYVKDDSEDTFIFKDESYESEKSAKIVASRYRNSEMRDLNANRTVSTQEVTAIWSVVRVVNGHLA